MRFTNTKCDIFRHMSFDFYRLRCCIPPSKILYNLLTTSLKTEKWSFFSFSVSYVVGSKSFLPDIQKPRQMENAVRDI